MKKKSAVLWTVVALAGLYASLASLDTSVLHNFLLRGGHKERAATSAHNRFLKQEVEHKTLNHSAEFIQGFQSVLPLGDNGTEVTYTGSWLTGVTESFKISQNLAHHWGDAMVDFEYEHHNEHMKKFGAGEEVADFEEIYNKDWLRI